MQKKESPDFRILEVGISGLCTTTTANNLAHCSSSLTNKYLSPITSIYLFFFTAALPPAISSSHY